MAKRNQKSEVDTSPCHVQVCVVKPCYSIPEFVAIHPISRSAIYAEIAAGRLTARRSAGKTVILHSDYLNYLEQLPKADPVGNR